MFAFTLEKLFYAKYLGSQATGLLQLYLKVMF